MMCWIDTPAKLLYFCNCNFLQYVFAATEWMLHQKQQTQLGWLDWSESELRFFQIGGSQIRVNSCDLFISNHSRLGCCSPPTKIVNFCNCTYFPAVIAVCNQLNAAPENKSKRVRRGPDSSTQPNWREGTKLGWVSRFMLKSNSCKALFHLQTNLCKGSFLRSPLKERCQFLQLQFPAVIATGWNAAPQTKDSHGDKGVIEVRWSPDSTCTATGLGWVGLWTRTAANIQYFINCCCEFCFLTLCSASNQAKVEFPSLCTRGQETSTRTTKPSHVCFYALRVKARKRRATFEVIDISQIDVREDPRRDKLKLRDVLHIQDGERERTSRKMTLPATLRSSLFLRSKLNSYQPFIWEVRWGEARRTNPRPRRRVGKLQGREDQCPCFFSLPFFCNQILHFLP